MRLRNPRLWIGVFSAAAVLTVAVVDLERESPGPLAAVHERAPELDGGASCSSCHGGWFRSMAEACLDCHGDVGAQIEAHGGLHGTLAPDQAGLCALCHGEHHGADFPLVNRQSFAAAGVEDPDRFDHRRVGFEMSGKHLELDCAKCHENAHVAILPEGGRRYGGLDKDCSGCHDDPHEPSYALGCTSCHGQVAFDELSSARHDEHLALVGGHAEVSCSDCHAADSTHSLDTLGRRNGPRVTTRACADCHDSPHRDTFVEGVARLAATATSTSCTACHDIEHVSFSDERLTLTVEQHARSGFPLTAPHDSAECSDCHDPDARDFAARHPGRGPDQCSACHEDPHDGQFSDGPFASIGCVGCHDRLHFEPHAFTVDAHARAALPLTGTHLETDCESCHVVPEGGGARVFHGTPSTCESCHGDAHRGFFDHFAGELTAADPGRELEDGALSAASHGACAHCHRTTTFSDGAAHGFDHARWTGFAVRGAHEQAECEICHPRAEEADRFGRMFGRVSEHFGQFDGCASCHADPHDGRFDKRGLPRSEDDKTGCARCHVETSFRTFPEGFDHRRWTGFALDGAHKSAGCAACHPPLPRAEESGRTWGRARGARCADCHDDPHGGQFRRSGRTDCRRCHRSGKGFGDLAFNHEVHSRFRLGDAHASLRCSACHKTKRHGDDEIVHYRPMGRDCVDCHGPQQNPLRRRKGRRR